MEIIVKFSEALPCVKSPVSRTAGPILRGDVSGKRFSTHVGEGNVADVTQERLSDGTGRIDTGHSATGYHHRAPVMEHPSREALPRINAAEQHHSGI